MNQARSDGLILRHWRRKPTTAPPVQDGEDVTMDNGEDMEAHIENSSEFLKYNISVDLPTFTDEEYDAHLRSDDWSREETDYLFEVVRDYSYRWAVIWDRYDYQPANNSHLAQDAANGNDASQALAALPFAPPKTRTVEDLKARFYDISAKLMKLRIPEMQMDADQYALYETLSKFDPSLERNRKNLAAALMNRNMDEVKEEEFLLAELQRINMAANRLDAEREELRARLDAPASNSQVQAGLASFTSSQALQALFSQLFQQDARLGRHLRRPRTPQPQCLRPRANPVVIHTPAIRRTPPVNRDPTSRSPNPHPHAPPAAGTPLQRLHARPPHLGRHIRL
jgi:DNA methyltransferase 1-associated protein 1